MGVPLRSASNSDTGRPCVARKTSAGRLCSRRAGSVVKIMTPRVIANHAARSYIVSGGTMSTRRCFW